MTTPRSSNPTYKKAIALVLSGKSMPEISDILGVPYSTVAVWVKASGHTPARPPNKHAAKRAKHLQRVRHLFDEGWPVNRIAKEIGTSRGTVNSCLSDMGLHRPDVSEGNRRGAPFLSADEWAERTNAAHDAAMKRGFSAVTQVDNSLRCQSSMRYVGRGERYVSDQLVRAGIDCTPQAAVNGYNIDILCDRVAVEIHNVSSRPTHTTRVSGRIVDLLSRGLDVVYIWFDDRRGKPITTDAINYLIAFIQERSGHPSTVGKYLVIRGDGKPDPTSNRHLNHFASVMAAYGRLCADSTDTNIG